MRAERLGFDSVWMSDHLFATLGRYGGGDERYGSLEPLSTLAALAPLTERVRLGTLVLSAAFRHPAIVAKTVTAIDRLSNGRVELGLGAGWFADEYEAFGYGFGSVGERFALLEETHGVPRRVVRGRAGVVRGASVRAARGLQPTAAGAGAAAAAARGRQGRPAAAAARGAVRRRLEHGLAVDARGVRGAGGAPPARPASAWAAIPRRSGSRSACSRSSARTRRTWSVATS